MVMVGKTKKQRNKRTEKQDKVFRFLSFSVFKSNKGVGLIEIIIAVAIINLAFFSLSQLGVSALRVLREEKRAVEASYLAQETIEAVRNVRDQNWANISGLSMGADYHPVISGSLQSWSLVSGSENINNYNRKIVITNAQRDVNDKIVSSGGTDDPNTKKITATASWGSKKVEISTYVTNFR